MPSISLSGWKSTVIGQEGAWVPIVYNGDISIINITPSIGIHKFDFISDKAYCSYIGNVNRSFFSRIVSFKFRFPIVEVLVCACYITENVKNLDVLKYVINVKDFDANCETINTFEGLCTHEGDINYSIFIPPRTLLLNVTDTSYIKLIDVFDGTIETIDTGISIGFPGGFYTIRNGNVIVFLGSWQDGDYYRVLNLSNRSVENLGFTAIGAKPTMNAGVEIVFGSEIYYPLIPTYGPNKNSKITIIDKNFNKINDIDLQSITGYTYNEAYSGFTVIGKLSNDNYASLIAIANNTWDRATKLALYYLELDDNFNIVNKQLLHEFTDEEELNEINYYIRDKIISLRPTCSEWTVKPIVDTYNKIVYLMYGGKAYDTEGNFIDLYTRFIYVDISDLDIVEWNQALWLINY